MKGTQNILQNYLVVSYNQLGCFASTSGNISSQTYSILSVIISPYFSSTLNIYIFELHVYETSFRIPICLIHLDQIRQSCWRLSHEFDSKIHKILIYFFHNARQYLIFHQPLISQAEFLWIRYLKYMLQVQPILQLLMPL